MKYKGAYTRTKTKLMMPLEGGMASKMQVMEGNVKESALLKEQQRKEQPQGGKSAVIENTLERKP